MAGLQDVTQPLVRSSARYTVEVARCILFGVLVSGLCGTAFFLLAGRSNGRFLGLAVALCAVVFPLAYAAVGHKRGISRVLASLSRSHGALLYDQTLGRFVETVESRRPGAFALALGSPEKLMHGFRAYLQERPAMPRLVRRVAGHYVTRLASRLEDGSLPVSGMVVDGRVNAAAFRHWAVERMHSQFQPTWDGFFTVAGVQFAALGVLAWLSC